MSNDPDMIYVIDDGDTFEGTAAQFAECFFSNATFENILQWCKDSGYKLAVRYSDGESTILHDLDGFKVSFIGSERGMTQKQKDILKELLSQLNISEFHHNDDIGASAQAHIMLYDRREADKIYLHPSDDKTRRFFSSGCRIIYAPVPVRDSYKSLVEACSLLIVAADPLSIPSKSDISYAIKLARKLGRQIIFLDP